MASAIDIKYRGFITARGIKFIALIAMTLSQFAMVASILIKLETYLAPDQQPFLSEGLLSVLTALGNITFPLLLIASFSAIFSETETILKSLIMNAILALITYIFCAFFLYGIVKEFVVEVPETLVQYVDPQKLIETISENPQIYSILGIDTSSGTGAMIPGLIDSIKAGMEQVDIQELLNEFLPEISGTVSKFIIINYVNINVFWDLTICTLFYFFLSYQPKKLQGGRLMLFRCCAVFPALYVVCSTFISGLLKSNMIDMPVWAIALLTSPKLPSYILFFLIVLLFKYKEVDHISKGGTYSSYLESLKTNMMSLNFSIYVCICIGIISLLNYALSGIEALHNWGIGVYGNMYIAIPIIMLFSYCKKSKRKWPNIFIPVYYIINYSALLIAVIGLIVVIPKMLEEIATTGVLPF